MSNRGGIGGDIEIRGASMQCQIGGDKISKVEAPLCNIKIEAHL
jgi:hypothetical protein